MDCDCLVRCLMLSSSHSLHCLFFLPAFFVVMVIDSSALYEEIPVDNVEARRQFCAHPHVHDNCNENTRKITLPSAIGK